MEHLMGYQVRDKNNKLPKGMNSCEVYTLKACLRIVIKDRIKWCLIPIWLDDIENPTIVQKNGVRARIGILNT